MCIHTSIGDSKVTLERFVTSRHLSQVQLKTTSGLVHVMYG